MALLACPFCREMFEVGEAETCPVCGMELTRFDKLPPSIDAMNDEAGVPTAPELEPLPPLSLARGKGLALALGLVGIALFFLPWVHLTMPYEDHKSGFVLARERIGWLWGSFVCWMVYVPTILSRRTIAQLRGARVAAAFLAAVPLVAVGILFARPPRGGIIPVRYTWEWPVYALVGVALAALAVAVRLGGRVDEIKVDRGSSRGQTVH